MSSSQGGEHSVILNAMRSYSAYGTCRRHGSAKPGPTPPPPRFGGRLTNPALKAQIPSNAQIADPLQPPSFSPPVAAANVRCYVRGSKVPYGALCTPGHRVDKQHYADAWAADLVIFANKANFRNVNSPGDSEDVAITLQEGSLSSQGIWVTWGGRLIRRRGGSTVWRREHECRMRHRH